MSQAPECVWRLEGELLEGPVWVARDAALWFVDIKKKRIHRFDPASGEKRSFEAPEPPGFVLPKQAGGFVAGLQSGLHHWDERDGFAPLAAVEPDLADNRLNDAVVDPAGRLWFGSMDNLEEAARGALYRLDAQGKVIAAGPRCSITNGPAFSPDGRTCYFVDTLARSVHAYPLGEDGALGDGRIFCTIDEGDGYPDGPSVDAEGCVWIGLFGGWSARRYSPAGDLLESVAFPVANVTKVAFGGPDLKTAYATTARHGLTAEAIADQPLAGGLFSFAVDVPGLAPVPIREGV